MLRACITCKLCGGLNMLICGTAAMCTCAVAGYLCFHRSFTQHAKSTKVVTILEGLKCAFLRHIRLSKGADVVGEHNLLS